MWPFKKWFSETASLVASSASDSRSAKHPAPAPALAPVAIVSVADRWTSSVSSGLTPIRLAAILSESAQGYLTNLLDLFDDVVEKDVHLAAEMFKRRMAVAGLAWKISPAIVTGQPAAAGDGRAEEIAAFVETTLKAIPRFGLMLFELTEAISHGFAVAEIDWALGPDGSGGQPASRVTVKGIRPWPQRKFNLKCDDPSQAEWLGFYPGTVGTELAPLPERKFIVHQYTRKGSLLRSGLLRTLLWLYLFKNYSLKDWVSFLEIFAVPLRVGTYGVGATPKDIEILTRAVIQIAVDQGAVISEACKIQFIEAQKYGTSEAFERFARFINAETSKAIVGQTLSAQTSETGGGAMALGQVHAEVRQDIVEFDAPLLQETINQDLIRPLVDFNFGPQASYPQFKIEYETPTDRQALALLIKTAGEAGIEIGQTWAQGQLGIPATEEGEKILRPQASSLPPPASLSALAAAKDKAAAKAGDVRDAHASAAQERMKGIYAEHLAALTAAAAAGKELPKLDWAPFREQLRQEMVLADLAGRAREAALVEKKR